MCADVGEPRLDLGNPVRIGGSLRFVQEPHTLGVAVEDDFNQGFGTIRRLLQEATNTGAARQRHLPALGCNLAGDDAE